MVPPKANSSQPKKPLGPRDTWPDFEDEDDEWQEDDALYGRAGESLLPAKAWRARSTRGTLRSIPAT
jgi:hypothetical protein